MNSKKVAQANEVLALVLQFTVSENNKARVRRRLTRIRRRLSAYVM